MNTLFEYLSQVVEQPVIFLCSYRLITHKLIYMVYKQFFFINLDTINHFI